MNNSLALPRLQRLHNRQSIRMRGAIPQITVNNNLPPSAPLPSLKQCFIAFFPSASVIPEVLCLISPHQCLPPRGRVDLLIGSCDQTYGGTRHRPELPRDKSRLVGCFPPLSPRRGAEQHRGPWPGPATRWRKVQANVSNADSTISVSGCGKVLLSPPSSPSSFRRGSNCGMLPKSSIVYLNCRIHFSTPVTVTVLIPVMKHWQGCAAIFTDWAKWWLHTRLLLSSTQLCAHWKLIKGSSTPSGSKNMWGSTWCAFLCALFQRPECKTPPHLSSYTEQGVAMAMHPWSGTCSDPHWPWLVTFDI